MSLTRSLLGMRVFLSYLREYEAEASQVATLLERRGFNVFLDQHRFSGGDEWEAIIRDHITKARVFIVLFPGHPRGPKASHPPPDDEDAVAKAEEALKKRYFWTELRLMRAVSGDDWRHFIVVMMDGDDEAGLGGLNVFHRVERGWSPQAWMGNVVTAAMSFKRKVRGTAAVRMGLASLIVAVSATGWAFRTPPHLRYTQQLETPVPITVFGPAQDRYTEFGASHVRGIVSGLMQTLKERCGLEAAEYDRYFEIRFVDSYPFLDDRGALHAAFRDAQGTSSTVFGPMFSELAVDALKDAEGAIQVPTILTLAATPRVRSAPEYGTSIFQLSASIDTYVGQMVRYLAEYRDPRPDELLVLYRDDEYGVSAFKAFVDHGTDRGFEVHGEDFPFRLPDGEESAVAVASEALERLLAESHTKSSKRVLAIIGVGGRLTSLVKHARALDPDMQVVTTTSVETEAIETGAFDGVLLQYTYAPRQFSVNTLSFLKYTSLANAEVKAFLPDYDGHWQRPTTMDAEVHDATIYWLDHMILPYLDGLDCGPRDINPFVTDFFVAGEGGDFGNSGAILLFRVDGNRMVPVEHGVWSAPTPPAPHFDSETPDPGSHP